MKKILLSLVLVLGLVCSGCSQKEEKTLVVYFSYTGHTERLSKVIANQLNADIYQIEVENPYTEKDTEYGPKNRAYKEQKDPVARPELKGELPDMNQYDRVIIGYPIWHGLAAKAMYTFVESVKWDGQQVIPFCTSAQSSMGDSAKELKKRAAKSKWKKGKRFKQDADDKEVIEWIKKVTE